MPPNDHSTSTVHIHSNQVSYTKKWGSGKLQVRLSDIPNYIAKDDKGKIWFNKTNRNESMSISTDTFNGNKSTMY